MGTKRTKANLTREEVLDAAMKLAERQGMDLSMRDLAEALNTWANTIYAFFESKSRLQQALVNHIVDHTFDEATLAQMMRPGRPWTEPLREAGLAMFDMAAKYRGLGPLMLALGMGTTSRSMLLIPALVLVLMREGLSEERAALVLHTAINYILSLGQTLALYEAGLTNSEAYQAAVDQADGMPMATTRKVFFDYTGPERVEQGISIFIAAVEKELGQ